MTFSRDNHIPLSPSTTMDEDSTETTFPQSQSTTREEDPNKPPPHHNESNLLFQKLWKHSTEDSNLSLYGFRRYKTSHLLNLRYLEEELSKVDHEIYQAGLRSVREIKSQDRLGLRYSKRDPNPPGEESENIKPELILKLRGLVKDYDDALIAFNQMMNMATFSLFDDESQCVKRSDLHLYEMYHTRLLRIDLGINSLREDPFQQVLTRWLRALRYRSLSTKFQNDEETGRQGSEDHTSPKKWSYQNTIFLAEVISRFLVALVAGAFMVVPLVMLSYQRNQRDHLITISVWIAVFSLLVSIFMKVSNQATVGVVAAYAAILSVFVSNS